MRVIPKEKHGRLCFPVWASGYVGAREKFEMEVEMGWEEVEGARERYRIIS